MQNDPTLDELLDEPIVRMLMTSDSVSAGEIRRLMDEARRRKCGEIRRQFTDFGAAPVGKAAPGVRIR